jgi:F-type H+-transporting ATPase subunit b
MAETTSAHTEVPSGVHEQFPPFRRDTMASQLFWFAITFIALYVFAAKIGLPHIAGILQERHGRIAGDLAAAHRFKEEADAAIVAYEEALTEARTRAQTIASETHNQLNAEAEKTRKALEARLNAKLVEAETAIGATKKKAMDNVRGIALEAAATIVARLTGITPAEKVVADAVDNALKR